MSKKSAKFATAVAIGIVLAVTTSLRAASAADDCLTEPKGPSPQGKHWYYRIERGTQRHCWYLRGQDDTAASTTAQDTSSATDDDASPTKDEAVAERDQASPAKPTAKRAAKQVEPPAMRSIADARAELPAKTSADAGAAAPAPASPAAVAPASPNAPSASVWPDPRAALAARPVVDASSADADTQTDTTASTAPEPTPSPAPLTQAAPLRDRQLAERHLGSIPMLLLVALGALGLAGLTGSTVYRLASARRRVRPEDRWTRNVALQPAPPPRRRQPQISVRPEPIREDVQDNFAQDEFEQDDFGQDQFEPEHFAREPVRQARFELQPQATPAPARTGSGNQRREQIEAYLAQLTRQLQADLDATARVE